MKKFTSLLLGGLLALTVSANATQPQVILNNNTNYEVRIDGQVYSSGSNTVQTLNLGNHTVEVYSVTAGGILGMGKKRTLVSSSAFNLAYNDVFIDVNTNGYAQITERRTNGNGGYNNGNGTYNNGNGGYGNNTGGYGNNNGNCNKDKGNNGRGHAYGKYKNKKDKKDKKYDDDRYDQNDRGNNRNNNNDQHYRRN